MVEWILDLMEPFVLSVRLGVMEFVVTTLFVGTLLFSLMVIKDDAMQQRQ